MRLLVVLMLLAMLGSLFSGLYFLHRERGSSRRMVQALTWRIGLAIALFVVLLTAFRLGFMPA